MWNAIEELHCLSKLIPAEENERKKWSLESSGFTKFKKAIGLENWTIELDSRLLIGIYEYGMGAWSLIAQDPLIKGVGGVVDEEAKFHKDLQKRADYLCRVLNKQLPLVQSEKKKKKKKEPPPKKEKKKRTNNKKKKDSIPMHFSSNSTPTPVAVLGDLDPLIFNECKEKMRPVKKALKSLDNPDKELNEKEQIQQTRSCLIQIGKRIEEVIGEIGGGVVNEEEEREGRKREWKSYLWYFVSKFTEFDAKNLYKVYKKAVKKEKPKKKKKKSKKESGSSKKKNKEKKSVPQEVQNHQNNDSNSSDYKYRPNRYNETSFEQSFHQSYNNYPKNYSERGEDPRRNNRHYENNNRRPSAVPQQWQQQQPQWHDRYNSRDYYKYNNAPRVAPPLNKEEWRNNNSDPRLHGSSSGSGSRRYDY